MAVDGLNKPFPQLKLDELSVLHVVQVAIKVKLHFLVDRFLQV